MSKVLITGGAGFIGSNFVYYWLKNHPKDKITVLDALTFAGNLENLTPVINKINFIEGDIRKRDDVKRAMKGIDAVVHFAAESHVDRSIFDPATFWSTNVKGTKVLLEEALKLGVPRFHHVSTDEVYGELTLDSKERFNEKTPYAPRPDNLYAISKAEADHVVRTFAKENPKLFVTISNCSNNYGPYQFPEKFVPIVVTNLIDGYKVPVHGDGLHTRDWIHTEDHAKAVDLILEKGVRGETYLVGAENDLPNKFIAERLVDLYGKDESWIKYVPDRQSNDRRYAIDSAKIVHELGWKPQITKENFDEGLNETISWYKRNEDWWRPLLTRRAPLSSGDKKVYAFLSVDRETGKVKMSYKSFEKEGEVDTGPLEEKMIKETGKVRLVKEKLKSRKWYKASSKAIRSELQEMTENPRTHGFVEDIANRPDEIGGVKQVKLLKLEHAPKKYKIYGIGSWFLVEKDKNRWVEGFYSWGMGPKSGAKLLVLLRHKGEISHLALVKNDKFPVGARVYDVVGGFPKLNESIFELITRKLGEELGIYEGNKSMKVGEIIGLGRVMPDPGMTNNHPFLYAVIIDVADKIFPPLNVGEDYETPEGMVLWPINRLGEIVNRMDDAYFLSALTRFTLGGITDIKL